MVTHDDHLAAYADRVFHIIDGEIVKVEDNRKKMLKIQSGKQETEDAKTVSSVKKTKEREEQ